MPQEIRDIIWSNAVTGFDFPDLVENDGILISTELGINKRTLKSRLYRGLVMRLMGMGTISEYYVMHTYSYIAFITLACLLHIFFDPFEKTSPVYLYSQQVRCLQWLLWLMPWHFHAARCGCSGRLSSIKATDFQPINI